MVTYANRAQVYTATTGTGTITFGDAVPGYQTFGAAGVSLYDYVRYLILDDDHAWEIGRGKYSSPFGSPVRTLSRSVIAESSNGGAAIDLTGNATVSVIAAAEDHVDPAVISVLEAGIGILEADVAILESGKEDVALTGTWTPVISDAYTGGNLGSTFSTEGNYTLLGNGLIHVQCELFNIDTTGMSGVSFFIIQGLPVAPAYINLGTAFPQNFTQTAGGIQVTPLLEEGKTYFTLREPVSGGSTHIVTVNQFTSGTADLWLSLTYQT